MSMSFAFPNCCGASYFNLDHVDFTKGMEWLSKHEISSYSTGILVLSVDKDLKDIYHKELTEFRGFIQTYPDDPTQDVLYHKDLHFFRGKRVLTEEEKKIEEEEKKLKRREAAKRAAETRKINQAKADAQKLSAPPQNVVVDTVGPTVVPLVSGSCNYIVIDDYIYKDEVIKNFYVTLNESAKSAKRYRSYEKAYHATHGSIKKYSKK